MWEQIRSNRRKSVLLVIVMAALLVALGYFLGEGLQPGAGTFGILIATIIWVVMSLVSYFAGANVLMAVSGAHKIRKEDSPQLYNVVEEMTIAAGLKKVPDIYIMDSTVPNAFAAGRDPDHAVVAVTSGLLGKLNRDQLQGVIAHEVSHIVHRDVLFMTLIGVMVGAIAMIADMFMRGLWYGSITGHRPRSRSSEDRGGGQAQAVMLIIAVVLAILAPILAHFIYLAASRRREYLADAGAVVLTRYPEGLASALEVIADEAREPLPAATRTTAGMYIVNPLKPRIARANWFSTHPPLDERVRILRGMAGGHEASFKGYQSAWQGVSGGAEVPAAALALSGQPLRQAASEMPPAMGLREAQDTVRRAHDYRFLECACGMKLKLPPNYPHPAVRCQRCGRTLTVTTQDV